MTPSQNSQDMRERKYDDPKPRAGSKRRIQDIDHSINTPKRRRTSAETDINDSEDEFLDKMINLLEEEENEVQRQAAEEVRNPGNNVSEGWCKVYHKEQKSWHLGYQLSNTGCDIHLFKRQNATRASTKGVRYQPIWCRKNGRNGYQELYQDMQPRGEWKAWKIKNLLNEGYTAIKQIAIKSKYELGKKLYLTPQEDDNARLD